MGKRIYFERKFDAESTRRMMEEVSGQTVELLHNHKGWYCSVDKDYLTRDGVTASVGMILYALNEEFEIVEYNSENGCAKVRVRPLCGTEGDKDKDVREGIVWYFRGTAEEFQKLLNHAFFNAIDGRNSMDDGDYVYLEPQGENYEIKRNGESLELVETPYCPTSLQCVEIIDNEMRAIHDIHQRQRSHYLRDFYSRPLTKRERFIAKLREWNSETGTMEILIPSLLMTGLFLGMLAFIFMFIRELSEVLHQ